MNISWHRLYMYVRWLAALAMVVLKLSSSQYYDCENITESTLAFRNAIGEPEYHQQDDDFCMRRLYGINRSVLEKI